MGTKFFFSGFALIDSVFASASTELRPNYSKVKDPSFLFLLTLHTQVVRVY
jgi:hypothetical protein